jgi:hypothetical protein
LGEQSYIIDYALLSHAARLSRQSNLNVGPQDPESTIQVLGKRGRDSSTVLESPFTAGKALGEKAGVNSLYVTDASGLTPMQSPKKRQRVQAGDSPDDETSNMQSPFRLSSRDEHVLADNVPTTGMDFSSLFNFNNASGTHDAPTLDQTSETMLGVPPPGFTADFLTRPTTPLPFALTPIGASGSKALEGIADSRMRRDDHHISPRKATGNRLNPYKRTATTNVPPSRLRMSSDAIDPFNFLGSEPLSSNMHDETSVGINPAQLLAQDIFGPQKTPAAARTLYGTELEGDTRFGEFGIDGLTKNFWKAPGFPC